MTSRLPQSRARRLATPMLPLYRKSVGRLANKLFQLDLLERTENFSDVRWLGNPIWQDVLDLWSLQEAISEIKPDLFIETGTFQGGSSMFVANLFDLLGHGEVVTIDVEKQHDLSHPRITYLIGSSTDPGIVSEVAARVESAGGRAMANLDSDHSERHVYDELNAYAPLIPADGKILVQDGLIDALPLPGLKALRPGPVPAIKRFIAENADWQLDARNGRFPITSHPLGWLSRKP